ncbi:MAG: heavy-metal-associated domain-containing protein [Bacillota bacterium]
MSWYGEKTSKLMEEYQKSLKPFFIPSYPMHEYYQEAAMVNSNNYSSVKTVNMVITNMRTQDDYNKINEALSKINGVKSTNSHGPGKLSVTFDAGLTRIEELVYVISILGYRYINRF